MFHYRHSSSSSAPLTAVVVALMTVFGLSVGQYVHHSPVVHHGQGASYQSRTYFGNQVGHVQQYLPAAVAPVAYAGHPLAYAASPVVSKAPAAPAAVAAPSVTKTYAAVPKPVSYTTSAKSYAPAAYKPSVYQPVAQTYSSGYSSPSYKYDPENPSKPFNYKYEYTGEAASNFNLNAPADQIVDGAIYETKEQGEKVVKALRVLLNNKLLKSVIGNSDDPCAIISEDLDSTVQGLIDGVSASRPQLVSLIASLQEMKAYEKDTARVIKTASRAVKEVEPLLPLFSNVFKTNPGCEASIDATIKKFDSVGNVLETLGRTNLVSSDNYTKKRLQQGGQASKIVGRVALDLENNQLLNLCSNSPTFTRDVFKGVGGLLSGFKEIIVTFNDGQNNQDLQKLDETVNVINDGAVSILFHYLCPSYI